MSLASYGPWRLSVLQAALKVSTFRAALFELHLVILEAQDVLVATENVADDDFAGT